MAFSIGLAPALWVLLATWRKWPVSTTHAVVGGLLGAGVTALGMSGIAWNNTLLKIGLPLLVSPLLAIGLAYMLSPLLQKTVFTLEKIRFCLLPTPKLAFVTANKMEKVEAKSCIVCHCDSPEAATHHNIAVSVNHMHWLTSGMLSFSRGLNDTPKLIAVILPFLLAGNLPKESMLWMFIVSATAMAAGGLLVGSRITKVLGFKVTELDHTQGFSANAVATFIVLFASKLGLPVSTTHVSACSIMGLGLSDGRGINKNTVFSMLFAWLITVPIAALFATIIYYLIGSV
jgi:PiT family inorganic phosphate transporter